MEDENIVEKVEDSIKEDRRWCVYIHRNMINDKAYIGVTNQNPEDRWGKNGNGYAEDQPVIHNAIQKYGWNNFEHIIFADNLTSTEAYCMEVQLIALFQTNCCRHRHPERGYNCTDGGEGVLGTSITEETRKKMSLKAKERLKDPTNHPMYGVHRYGIDGPHYGKMHSNESKQKMSESRKGKCCGEDNPMYGKCHSDEVRRIMSEHHADFRGEKHPRFGRTETYIGIHNGKSRHVYCVEFNQIFVTITEAYKVVGVQNISLCCRGIRKSAGKCPNTQQPLHWLYVEDAIKQGYITQERLDNYLNTLKGDVVDDGETV